MIVLFFGPFEDPSGEDEGRGVNEDDRIEGSLVCTNEGAAKKAMTTNAGVVREMLVIIGDHAHETYCKKGSRKDLVDEWFLRPNAARTYLFFSSKGLSKNVGCKANENRK